MTDSGPVQPWDNPMAHPADRQRMDPLFNVPKPAEMTFPQPAAPPTRYYPNAPGYDMKDAIPALGTMASGDFLLNVVFVGLFWEVFIVLQPLSAAAGALTIFFGWPLLRLTVGDGLIATVVPYIAAAVVFWIVSRIENTMARSNFYRIPRHLIRLFLISTIVVMSVQRFMGIPLPTAISNSRVVPTLQDSKLLGIFLVTILAAHFFLWNFTSARKFWHRRLVAARLRKPGT
jgi:hypothetical protein